MKKALFAYNPMSGNRFVPQNLDAITKCFQKEGVYLELYRISEKDRLIEYIKYTKADFIIGAGGDGTLSQIITSMVRYGMYLPFMALGTGTSNNFTRNLDASKSITTMEQAEKIIHDSCNGTIQTIDVGLINKKQVFLTSLAGGNFVDTTFETDKKLKQRLGDIIEHDFVQTKVEQQETKVVENVQKTKEDEIRDRLRSFTRTIPMFIMANSSKGEITIDNFDQNISDEDFVDLTNITKEEFHTLRDGFDYTAENGERKTFGGVFDRYRFNASIAEFQAEKVAKANYFTNDEDIFELIPNQKNNQIFTPRKVVKMMVDGLEKENPELFRRTDSTFIDLYMKSGMYITEIVKKLFANTRQN